MESIEGVGAKAKHKDNDRRKNRTFTTLRGRRKEALNFSENAIFVKIIMGYGRVSSLKMHLSMRDEELPKTRDYVFVVYLTVTKGRTASEQANVEKTAVEEITSSQVTSSI